MIRTGAACLCVITGASALVLELAWIRQFTVLFGTTERAAAAVLAAWFLGLAAGNAVFARLAPRSRRPLRLYGLLECGVALAALWVPLALRLHQTAVPALATPFGTGGTAALLAKLACAALALGPATFCMGGSLPALAEAVAAGTPHPAARTAGLYALNTAGAVAGALLGGLVLPYSLGVRAGANLAAAAALGSGLAAVLLGSLPGGRRPPPVTAGAGEGGRTVADGLADQPAPRLPAVVAVYSGFAVFALEMLCARMFALFFPASAGNLAAVLAVFLVGLAAGAGLAGLLLRWRNWRPDVLLAIALGLAALAVASLPELFFLAPNAKGFGRMHAWSSLAQAGHALLVIGGSILPAVLAVGLVLPLAWAAAAPPAAAQTWRPGRAVGRLMAWNTLGVIAGCLAGGFCLVPWLGLQGSLQGVAAGYGLLGLLTIGLRVRGRLWQAVAGGALLLAGFAVWHGGLTELPGFFVPPGMRLLAQREGSGANVAVAERAGDRFLLVNNFVKEGGTAGAAEEELQGHLPLLLHPAPRRVAHIGLGTGITASAALVHPGLEQLVGVELSPDVLALLPYFRDWNRDLAADPRVALVREDGRAYLAGTTGTFDVIVTDLVQPYLAGAAYLFTREYYASVRARLRPGGVHVHWLPLYQLPAADVASIAATFRQAFPQSEVWLGGLHPERGGEVLGLVGWRDAAPPAAGPGIAQRLARLPPDAGPTLEFLRSEAAFRLLFAGELAHADWPEASVPVFTDDRPRLERSAAACAGADTAAAAQLATLCARLRAANLRSPQSRLARDPELAALNALTCTFAAARAGLPAAPPEPLPADAAVRRLAARFPRRP